MSDQGTFSENVSFIQRHIPPLKAGEYTIQAQQEVSLLGSSGGALNVSASKQIYVAGNRFTLSPKEVFSCYPPPGKWGTYHQVLPHLTLTRSTLPWERSTGDEASKTTPWLWLMVYDEQDVAAGHVKATQLATDTFMSQTGLSAEPGAATDAPVQVLQIDRQWLTTQQLLPTPKDLNLMAFVRKNEVAGKDTEHAICLANRMPNQGVTSYACLLSLEERLTGPEGQLKPASSGSDQMVSFACLHQWSFHALKDQCYEVGPSGMAQLNKLRPPVTSDLLKALTDQSLVGLFTNQRAFENALKKSLGTTWTALTQAQQTAILPCFKVRNRTFAGLLENLSSAPLYLPGAPDSSAQQASGPQSAISRYLNIGAIALPHELHTGQQTISWYHGPYRSSNQSSKPTLSDNLSTSDQLLRFDKELGMLDVSYASAWELGRLLMLNNKALTKQLYLLKRQQAWTSHQASSTYHQAFVASEGQQDEPQLSTEEQAVITWCNELLQLDHLPFNYLIPDERLLPEASIRFFTLDQQWICCLLRGALSLGQSPAAIPESVQETLSGPPVSGFFLRSEVVSGWPYLEVSAKDPTQQSLTILNRKRLGPDILLVLFKGQVDSVDLHLKAESLHFGFEYDLPEKPGYSKEVRFQFTKGANDVFMASSITSPPVVDVQWKNKPVSGNPDLKLVDMVAMNDLLQSKSQSGSEITFTSAQFAMEMITGVPNVSFSNQP